MVTYGLGVMPAYGEEEILTKEEIEIVSYYVVNVAGKWDNIIKLIMEDKVKKELQSAAFERLINHLRERKDVQNLDLMNLAGFCRNCLSKWYREEAEKKNINITDPEAREHIYGMPYAEWKEKYQK